MKKCPYCAEEIQDEAIVCRYCHRDLRSTGEKITQATRPVASATIKGIKLVATTLGGLAIVGCAAFLLLGNLLESWEHIDRAFFADRGYTQYSNSELGISFQTPSGMEFNVEEFQFTEPDGSTARETHLTAVRSDYTISMQVLDSAYLYTDPDSYGDEFLLKLYAASDIGRFNFEKNEKNAAAASLALDTVSISQIGGYPAAIYSITLENVENGKYYIRGAIINLPHRSISFAHMAFIEPSQRYYEAHRDFIFTSYWGEGTVDKNWTQFVNTFSTIDPNP